MYGSYVGVLAAGMTELLVRNWAEVTHGQSWLISLVATVAVTIAAIIAAPRVPRGA
jgi:hypothetical protein